MTNKIELLAPAGDLQRLKVAFAYGADAVFLGGKKFSLRTRASNFDIEDITEACKIAKSYKGKIYVTCNIFPLNDDLNDLKELEQYLLDLEKAGVDAIITSDLAIIDTCKKLCKKMQVHISTQLSSYNSESVNFFKDLGATRVVLARECTMEEIKEISSKSPIELEVFIHGAMCMSISGKCTLSNHMTNRDANRGGCAQSCRWFYNLYDKSNNLVTNKLFTLSSKDLRIIKEIKTLIEANVSSLKIEGRMKSEYYLATIISQYRKIIDDIYAGKLTNEKKYIKQLNKAASRPASYGFFKGIPTHKQQIYDKTAEIPLQNFVARVLSYDKHTKIATIEQRNNFTIKKKVEIFGPNGKLIKCKIKRMYTKDNEPVVIANHAKEILYIKTNHELNEFDMIRQNNTKQKKN